MDNEFEEVEVDNFGPFIGKHTLRLNNGPTLNFVTGRNEVEPALGANGAGKSKLLNSIMWCLYGVTSDGLLTPDIRPWHGKGQTAVTLKLITWDGDEGTRHTVKRTAGPNSITLDGRKVLQPEIDRLIGMSADVFRLAPFLGQGQPLFHDLPNREKLDFLVGVSGLDRWDTYSDRAKGKADTLDRDLQRIINEILVNRSRSDELAKQVERQNDEASVWEAGRAERLIDAEREIKRFTKIEAATGKTHAAVATKLDGAQLDLKLMETDERAFKDAATKADIEYRGIVERNARIEGDIERARAELVVLKESRQCPTCGQTIAREPNYLANLERVEGRVREYTASLNAGARQDAKKAVDTAYKQAERYTQLVQETRAIVDKLAGEERLLRNNLMEADYQLKSAIRIRDELTAGANPHRGRLAELRKAHKAALSDGTALYERRGVLDGQVERARYWVKGFKDIRLYVLQDLLTELEFATNAMLDTVGLIGWEVRYAVERETKTGTTQRGLITTVVSPNHDGDVKWKSWSGGEGQRLRLVGSLALSDVLLARAGVFCNIEVLDEPSRSLSPQGVADLIGFLAERARTHKKSIYLVDHMAIESSQFDRIVTVTKTKAGSSIR